MGSLGGGGGVGGFGGSSSIRLPCRLMKILLRLLRVAGEGDEEDAGEEGESCERGWGLAGEAPEEGPPTLPPMEKLGAGAGTAAETDASTGGNCRSEETPEDDCPNSTEGDGEEGERERLAVVVIGEDGDDEDDGDMVDVKALSLRLVKNSSTSGDFRGGDDDGGTTSTAGGLSARWNACCCCCCCCFDLPTMGRGSACFTKPWERVAVLPVLASSPLALPLLLAMVLDRSDATTSAGALTAVPPLLAPVAGGEGEGGIAGRGLPRWWSVDNEDVTTEVEAREGVALTAAAAAAAAVVRGLLLTPLAPLLAPTTIRLSSKERA